MKKVTFFIRKESMEVHSVCGRNSIPLECGVKIVHIFVKRFAYCNSEVVSCVLCVSSRPVCMIRKGSPPIKVERLVY
jgi:hypothetical protein